MNIFISQRQCRTQVNNNLLTTFKINIQTMKWDITYLKWKGFDANPQNINRGWRPRKQLSYIIEEIKGLWYSTPSQSEIIDICFLMLTLTEDDLSILSSNEEYPMIMRIIASRLTWTKGFETLEKILDRWIGKARQFTSWANNGFMNPLSSLSDDKLIEIIIN